jgi:hypothetical protein
LTNFSNGKQTQESLKSGFPETTFRETQTQLEFEIKNLEGLKYFLGNEMA